jgi:hypothetical protein
VTRENPLTSVEHAAPILNVSCSLWSLLQLIMSWYGASIAWHEGLTTLSELFELLKMLASQSLRLNPGVNTTLQVDM